MEGELFRIEIFQHEENKDAVVVEFHNHVKHPLTGELTVNTDRLVIEDADVRYAAEELPELLGDLLHGDEDEPPVPQDTVKEPVDVLE